MLYSGDRLRIAPHLGWASNFGPQDFDSTSVALGWLQLQWKQWRQCVSETGAMGPTGVPIER